MSAKSTDQTFTDIYDELGELASDLKALEFRFRKLARKMMRRRAVFQHALSDLGIEFVDSKAPEGA